MASNTKKSNSINDQTAQAIRNNQNVVELLTKMDQSLHSNDSYVTLKIVDSTGKETTAQFPTIGFFKQELDRISNAVKILSGIEGNPAAMQIAENAYKRIITADLNFEPRQINGLQPVTVFKTDPNWIFASFLNPKISIEIDLTDKIEQGIKTIESRRFIVMFDQIVTQDSNGNDVVKLTTLGQQRQNEFNTLYRGKSNIDMVEFVQWLDSPGLINSVDDTLIDEQFFRIEPNRLQFKGDFSVSGTEVDTINKKLWYILDTLTYYDVSNVSSPAQAIQLKIGDLVNVNPNIAGVVSTTVYKVIEISTITSDFRVRFEQVYGQEPIPTRLAALSLYSQTVPTRKVKVAIGFDEYCAVFVRSLDEDNNLIGKDWSSGIGFWTNELKLENEAGEQFSDYYIKHVYDYGLVLEDLVQKKVPNYYGLKPNAPLLSTDNFKVVQSNMHLTNTVEAEQIRDLHNTKNTLISQISQIQEAVDKQNRIIETSTFDSQADRKRVDDELATLQKRLQTTNETKITTIQNILASKKNLNKISPVFRLRGFWPMPDPVSNAKTQPQEAVQFEIWYKKTNKSGAENPLATFQDISNSAAILSAPENTTVNQNLSKPKTVNATFTNWVKYKTDSRKRTQDPITQQWKWEIEDVSSADTPNINQLDIEIFPGEVVQLKIKSLSEVGWPETPIESEFSNQIEVAFPDDLNNVLSDDQFILKEASADDIKVKFDKDLEARGLGLHLNSAVKIGDTYYAHTANAISSGFKDSKDNIINLYDYLATLVNKITSLEEQIKRGKGVLEIFLVNRGTKTKIINGNSLQFNVNLEDYVEKTKIGLLNNPKDALNSRTYKNDIYVVNDYSLEITNTAADSPLGLLSNRNYAQINGGQPSIFAYKYDVAGSTPQALWLNTANKVLGIEKPELGSGTDSQAPTFVSQLNNQWIWQQVQDINGSNIFTDVYDEAAGSAPTLWKDWVDFTNFGTISNKQVLTFIDPDRNSGMIRNKTGIQGTENSGALVNASATDPANPIGYDIAEQKRWTVVVPNATRYFSLYAHDTRYSRNDMATTIHPVITSYNDIIDTSAQHLKLIGPGSANGVIIPLNIYFRAYTGTKVQNVAGTSEFDETNIITLGGNMPVMSAATPYSVGAGNKLTIPFLSGNHGLLPGDKVVIVGLAALGTANALYNADSVPLRIITQTLTQLTVDYNVPTGFSQSTVGTTLIQVHLASKKITGSKELTQFSVYGALAGQDTPYVRSYVEISASNVAPTPMVHNKKLRFYIENEQSIRPIEFQFNWTITQYKKITNAINNININNTKNPNASTA